MFFYRPPPKALQMPVNPKKELWDQRSQKLQHITLSPAVLGASPDPEGTLGDWPHRPSCSFASDPAAFLHQVKFQQSSDRSPKTEWLLSSGQNIPLHKDINLLTLRRELNLSQLCLSDALSCLPTRKGEPLYYLTRKWRVVEENAKSNKQCIGSDSL